MTAQYIAILRKYKFELAYSERGRIVFRYFIENPPSAKFHEVTIHPNGTWEIIHYKYRRCYFAKMESPEDLDKFMFNRFPELRQ